MGNGTSQEYTSATIARDIVQIYTSSTVLDNKRRSGRIARQGRPVVKRLISEDRRAKRREQQANRLTLSDMELVCDGEKCRLVPSARAKRRISARLSQDSYTKSMPLKNARLDSECDSDEETDSEQEQDRVTPNKEKANRVNTDTSCTKTDKSEKAKQPESEDSESSIAKDTEASIQRRENVKLSIRPKSMVERVKSRDSKLAVSRTNSDGFMITSKSANSSPVPARKTRSIVLKDMEWLFTHSDMSGQASMLPRVTEIFYRL